MDFTHDEERQIHQAEGRDRFRNKLRQSKRWKAEVEAKELVATSVKMNDKRNKEESRRLKVAGRDESMNTIIKLTREDMSITRIVI